MQLGKFTDYGLRVLVHLSAAAPERVSVAKVAATFELSEHHLAKVCSRLVRGGFLVSERGRNGGLTLARDPSEIRLGAAVRCLSQDTALVECFGSGPCSCRLLPMCGVKQPLAEAMTAFFATLDRYTLADISRNRAALRDLLGVEAGV
ncbi:Rrf2 family transcriptional regulator [Gymnodinialimonas sp. 57CJ19]|uniref:RrF2 family transcriptional regulator n=1 Tax=Gymnodinialimonas sp. 57CJ19 TaxID=3138498 RepID=UPI00313425C5